MLTPINFFPFFGLCPSDNLKEWLEVEWGGIDAREREAVSESTAAHNVTYIRATKEPFDIRQIFALELENYIGLCWGFLDAFLHGCPCSYLFFRINRNRCVRN